MNTVQIISSIIGHILGIAFCGLIITGILAAYYALRGKSLTKQQARSIYIAACLIWLAAYLVARLAR